MVFETLFIGVALSLLFVEITDIYPGGILRKLHIHEYQVYIRAPTENFQGFGTILCTYKFGSLLLQYSLEELVRKLIVFCNQYGGTRPVVFLRI